MRRGDEAGRDIAVAKAKFVVLQKRLGISRSSLQRTLRALIDAGLVKKNPGYGHPMRPEYLLTERGAKVGAPAQALIAQDKLDDARALLEGVILQDGSISDAYAQLASIEHNEGDAPAALAHLDRAISAERGARASV